MLEKGRISSSQLGVMMFLTMIATVVLTVPSLTGKYAGNDMWLSPIWASGTGFLTLFIMVGLHRIFPGMSIIQYVEQITGVLIGKGIGILYVCFLIHTTGIVVRTYSEFIVNAFLDRTPIVVVASSMLLLTGYAVICGLETISRLAQFFLPLFLFPLLFFPLLGKDMEFGNIFPILNDGLIPSIKGAIVPQAWYSEIFLVNFLLPFLADPDKALRACVFSIIGMILDLILCCLVVLFIFGRQVTDLIYPVMYAFGYIRIADFLENLESLAMMLWVVGAFVKIAVFHYVSILSISQWLRLSSYRSVVWPITLFIGLCSMWAIPNQQELLYYTGTTFPILSLIVHVLLPSLLFGLAWLRFRSRKGTPAAAGHQNRRFGREG